MPIAMASLRLSTPSLVTILPKWKLAVRGLMPSFIAMSTLVMPLAAISRHCASRGDSGAIRTINDGS